MKFALALDSFKGSIGSVAAGEAAARGIRRALGEAECRVFPLADGGEGTVDALVAGLGGERRTVRVTGPLGVPVEATYGLLSGNRAVIEMAAAAGITLVDRAARNPLVATTFGVGEMILDALNQGVRHFIVGIGGSATNDGGVGMLQALGFRFLDDAGRDLPRGGAALARLARIERKVLEGVTFSVACDVTNPLCGSNGASAVFGPQKGATPEMVRELDAALQHYAEIAGGDATVPGAGAAGGMGYAFKTFLGASLVPGVDMVLAEVGLEEAVREADVVITGEGRLDGQTVMGKAPIGVARLAKKHGKPVVAFGGCLGAGVEAVNAAGIDAYFPILRAVTTLDEALRCENAEANLASCAEQVFRLWKTAKGGKG